MESLMTKDTQELTPSTASQNPSGRHAYLPGWNPGVITDSPYFIHSVNYQLQVNGIHQSKVKNKHVCLIQLTSTSLNLHANSQLFVWALKK